MTTKEAKGTNTPQMEPFGTQSYAEWAAAYQAYYGNGTSTPYPCFFPAVAVASGPQSQPYNWGGQPLMGPYGNMAFPCTYPYGYVHPTLAAGAVPYNPYAIPAPSTELVMAAPMADADAKSSLASGTKSFLASMIATNGSDETTKGTSGSECGTGGVSDRSEEEFTPNEFETTSKARFKKSKNGKCEAGTLTHLNGGTDYWSQPTPIRLQGKHRSADLSATSLPSLSGSQPLVQGQDGVSLDIWSQNDKETKRQKRKQSNRESARRSRLRKQAECGDLSTRVDSLMAENTSLRTELDRLSVECKKLLAENAAIMQSLQCDKGEANELSDEQQAMQSEEVGLVQETSFKRKPIFHLPNEISMTTLHDLGACAVSLMGQTDSIAAS